MLGSCRSKQIIRIRYFYDPVLIIVERANGVFPPEYYHAEIAQGSYNNKSARMLATGDNRLITGVEYRCIHNYNLLASLFLRFYVHFTAAKDSSGPVIASERS